MYSMDNELAALEKFSELASLQLAKFETTFEVYFAVFDG